MKPNRAGVLQRRLAPRPVGKKLSLLIAAAAIAPLPSCSSHLTVAADESAASGSNTSGEAKLVAVAPAPQVAAARADIARWPLLSGADLYANLIQDRGDPGSGVPVGGGAEALAGTWEGVLEQYRFDPSGSGRVRLSIEASGAGHFNFGSGAPPPQPTNPNEFWPPGYFGYSHLDPPTAPGWTRDGEFLGGVYEGFSYPLRRVGVSADLEAVGLPAAVFLRATSADLFSGWCSLQTSCYILAERIPTGNPGECALYERGSAPTDGGSEPIATRPCSTELKCIMHCSCDEDGCADNESAWQQYQQRGDQTWGRAALDISFDGQLESNSLSGWMRFVTPPFGYQIVTPIRFARVLDPK